MYGYFGTTVMQAALLSSGILTFGQITGHWLETSLVFASGALALSVLRRNQLYAWIEKRHRPSFGEIPGMWTDMAIRIQHREAELQAAHQALEERLLNLQRSLSSLDAGLVSLTPHWKINWWNIPAGRLLGLRQGYDEDASLFNLVRTPELIRYVEDASFDLPVTVPSPITSGRMLEYTVCSIRDTGYLLVIRDVTRFTRLERMRSDFVANVSHELKTPLTVIRGYLETMIDNQLVVPQGARAVTQALSQAERMNQLLQDLLLLSQLETTAPDPQPTPVLVRELLERAEREANELKVALQKAHTTIRIDEAPPVALLCEWKEMASALGNLCANAVRYSPDGATIQVRFTLDETVGVFSVSDNGPGIADEHVPRLTERFYRVDNSHSPTTGGTGLGLAIVKHVLLRHGGLVEIESKVGSGTTFRCILPKERFQSVD